MEHPDYKVDLSKGLGGNNDFVNPQIVVFNSYDKSSRLGGKFGFHRLVCDNGLTRFDEIYNSSKVLMKAGLNER